MHTSVLPTATPWRKTIIPFFAVVIVVAGTVLVMCVPCFLGFIWEALSEGFFYGRMLFGYTKESIIDWAEEQYDRIHQ
jgi:hypothetical protein